MVNFKSWAIVKAKLTTTKKPARCLAIISLVLRVNVQSNLITAPAEFDVIFDFAISLCSQKYNRKIQRSKNLLKFFFADGNFLYSGFQNLSCFPVANFVAYGKIFYSRSTLPENFFLLFLKTAYQNLFNVHNIRSVKK